MPVKTIIEFILYIIPGFLALELYHYFYPVKKRTDFYQIAWSIIYGVLIYSFVNFLDIKWLANTQYALHSDSTDFPGFQFLAVLLLVGVIVGFLRISLHKIRLVFTPLLKLIPLDPQSIWNKINQESNEDWAVVYLNDNSIYMGWIDEYTFDPNTDNQDFLLSPATRVDEDLKEKYKVTGIGVYMNTRDVRRIEFLKGEKKSCNP